MFEIEDVPFPEDHANKGLTATLKLLKPGQSVVLPLSARTSCYALASQIDIKIKTAQEYAKDTIEEYNQRLGHMVKIRPVIGIRVFRVY